MLRNGNTQLVQLLSIALRFGRLLLQWSLLQRRLRIADPLW